MNPFGIDEQIEQRAARIIQMVGAPWYGLGDNDGTPGQKSVTVVMIDHRFAAQAAAVPGGTAPSGEAVWPLPVSTLMLRVVKPIIRAHPAALFIDLTLPYAPRESAPGRAADVKHTIETLADHLADIDQDPSGVPVFLSDVIQANDDERSRHCPRDYVPSEDIEKSGLLARAIRERVFKSGRQGNLAMVDSAVLNPEGAYQLAPAASGPRGNCRDQASVNSGYIASPALALFAALCPNPTGIVPRPGAAKICGREDIAKLAKQIKVSSPRDANGLALYELASPADGAMELRWGAKLTQTMRDAYAHTPGRDKCFSQFHPSTLEPFVLALKIAVTPIARYFDRSMEHRCVYIDTIAPDDLAARFGGSPAPGRVERDFASVFIKDRIVLLGVDLTQAGDYYESPVNGNIPGVYVHAAAIENLLTRGFYFPRADPSLGWLLFLFFIDALAYVLMRRFWNYVFDHEFTTKSIFREFLFAPIVYFMIILVFGGLIVALLAQTSAPLVDIALPIAALHLLLLGKLAERFEERLKGRFIGSRAAASTGVGAHPGTPPMEVERSESVEVTVRETWTHQVARPSRPDEEGAEP